MVNLDLWAHQDLQDSRVQSVRQGLQVQWALTDSRDQLAVQGHRDPPDPKETQDHRDQADPLGHQGQQGFRGQRVLRGIRDPRVTRDYRDPQGPAQSEKMALLDPLGQLDLVDRLDHQGLKGQLGPRDKPGHKDNLVLAELRVFQVIRDPRALKDPADLLVSQAM